MFTTYYRAITTSFLVNINHRKHACNIPPQILFRDHQPRSNSERLVPKALMSRASYEKMARHASATTNSYPFLAKHSKQLSECSNCKSRGTITFTKATLFLPACLPNRRQVFGKEGKFPEKCSIKMDAFGASCQQRREEQQFSFLS